jgi:hypothetical protein
VSTIYDVDKDFGGKVYGTAQQDPFNRAVEAIRASGQVGATITCGNGPRIFTGPIKLGFPTGYNGISIRCDGPDSTTFRWAGPKSGALLQLGGVKNADFDGFGIWNTVKRDLDVQTVEVTGGPTGQFKLVYGTEESMPINVGGTALEVQTALESMLSFGFGQVACAGGPLGTAPVTVTLGGFLIGSPTKDFTVDSTGMTGGAATVTRTSVGSSMVGILSQRDTGQGTQNSSIRFGHIGVLGFDVGIQSPDPATGQANSEYSFAHLYAKICGIGVNLRNFNTLDMGIGFLEGSGNDIDVCMNGGSGAVSVDGGSISGSKVASFVSAGSNSGSFRIGVNRIETARMAGIFIGGRDLGVTFDNVLIRQSSAGPGAPMFYLDGGRVSINNTWVDGTILARTNRGALALSVRESWINDSVLVRVPDGYYAGKRNTLQGLTYSITNSHARNMAYGIAGNHFPDQVGVVLPGTDALVPLWSADTQTVGTVPSLYIGADKIGWSAGPIYGGLKVARVPDPPGKFAVYPVGGSGIDTYSYQLVAIDAHGNKTMVGPATTIVTGLPFASLDATHFVQINWPATGCYGAAAWDVIRVAGGTSQGAIALGIKTLTLQDTGLPATPYTAPTRNATGDLTVDGQLRFASTPTLPPDATDPATVQALVNALRAALIATGGAK